MTSRAGHPRTGARRRFRSAGVAVGLAIMAAGIASCGSDTPVQDNTPVAPANSPPATDTRTTNPPTLSNLPVTSAP